MQMVIGRGFNKNDLFFVIFLPIREMAARFELIRIINKFTVGSVNNKDSILEIQEPQRYLRATGIDQSEKYGVIQQDVANKYSEDLEPNAMLWMGKQPECISAVARNNNVDMHRSCNLLPTEKTMVLEALTSDSVLIHSIQEVNIRKSCKNGSEAIKSGVGTKRLYLEDGCNLYVNGQHYKFSSKATSAEQESVTVYAMSVDKITKQCAQKLEVYTISAGLSICIMGLITIAARMGYLHVLRKRVMSQPPRKGNSESSKETD